MKLEAEAARVEDLEEADLIDVTAWQWITASGITSHHNDNRKPNY